MNVIITIPKKIKWEDYEKELETVADGSQMMLFKVPFKNRPFLVSNGLNLNPSKKNRKR